MQIEKRNISELNPSKYNPRIMPSAEMQKLEKSIKEFGYCEPIIINKDNTVIGGHQRLEALKKLNNTKSIEVVVVDLDKKREKALNIALNRIHGTWDMNKLGEILVDLQDLPELELTGLDSKEIDLAIEEFRDKDETEDEIPPIPKNPQSKIGDLYILGKHRLLCGDSTKEKDVAKLMNDKKADMIFTDPPYGVSYGNKNKFLNAIAPANRIQENMQNDILPSEKIKLMWASAWKTAYEYTINKAVYYICSADADLLLLMMMSINENNWAIKQIIVWVKNNIILGRKDYKAQHENIIYGWKKKEHIIFMAKKENQLFGK